MSSGLTTKEALCRLTQTLSNIRIPNNGLEWTRAAFFDLPSHEVLLCSIHALSAVMIFIAAMLQWNVSCSLGDVVLMLTLLIVPFFTLWLIHRRLRAPGSYAAFALKKLLSDLGALPLVIL
ncbi:toxin-antitoxin system, toxin component, PIN domain protein [Opisthorchis viverrini]|uniref:Toxin-antitoxin system, toxin component, PIN domain protein n=1 Tax=Opisthorchis viverrini TaxID=6198 RepID=A0A1S8WGS8_OPIVI|nr:toxin-antitoxin system, toxin component, PIN domain protein [Opisthorchis viverrini]